MSRYCHLTGALGVALTLADDGVAQTSFRGLSLYREAVDLRYEGCELCHNHCKISVADVGRDRWMERDAGRGEREERDAYERSFHWDYLQVRDSGHDSPHRAKRRCAGTAEVIAVVGRRAVRG